MEKKKQRFIGNENRLVRKVIIRTHAGPESRKWNKFICAGSKCQLTSENQTSDKYIHSNKNNNNKKRNQNNGNIRQSLTDRYLRVYTGWHAKSWHLVRYDNYWLRDRWTDGKAESM